MGCVFPKPVPLDANSALQFFKVINIDQDGNDHLPGKIQITEDELVLHQKKKEPISWPIRTLRRYGYDRNVFSFEAGRRCPIGEGIFAFRCEHAEQLFRLLQLNIQRSSNSTQTSQGEFHYATNNYLEPRSARHESVGSQSSDPHTPVSPSVPFTSIYTFEEPKGSMDSVVLSPNSRPDSTPGSPFYTNIPDGVKNNEMDEVRSSPQDTYLYLSRPLPLTLPGSTFEFNRDETSPKNLQYITLELSNGQSSPLSRTPFSEEGRSPGYTTIDFQKTWALGQSTKPNAENDRGCTRRTRHNSTLSPCQ